MTSISTLQVKVSSLSNLLGTCRAYRPFFPKRYCSFAVLGRPGTTRLSLFRYLGWGILPPSHFIRVNLWTPIFSANSRIKSPLSSLNFLIYRAKVVGFFGICRVIIQWIQWLREEVDGRHFFKEVSMRVKLNSWKVFAGFPILPSVSCILTPAF